jgi:hypothetical protein
MVLHPSTRKWFYFDPVHVNWENSGYGVNEAIFAVADGTLGVQKLPHQEESRLRPIADWLIYLHVDKVHGPILKSDFTQRLAEGAIPAHVLVWDANMTDWQKAENVLALPSDADIARSFERLGSQTQGASAGQVRTHFDLIHEEYKQGRLAPEHYRDLLKALVLRDTEGRLWTIGTKSIKWYRREGRRWVEGIPSGPLVFDASKQQTGDSKRGTSGAPAARPDPPPQGSITIYCRACGRMLRPETKFCNKCGTPRR